MKFFQWLDNKAAEDIPKLEEGSKKKAAKKSVLAEKMYEIEHGVVDITSLSIDDSVNVEPTKEIKTKASKTIKKQNDTKFIDPVTGKEYKTARALKAGITRRLKKQTTNGDKK